VAKPTPLDLGRIHGHSGVGDDVVKVGDQCRTEGALALLNSELVLL
jgi:hypothetical protein